jgi:hypothetical protein
MELLKKHYEKIILGAVLLVLVVSAAMLPMMISSERDSQKAMAEEIINRRAQPIEPLNTSTQQARFTRLAVAGNIDLSTTNKVLNPLQWQKDSSGRPVPIKTGEETGPRSLVVTKQVPLHLNITFDNVSTNESGNRYVINVEREAHADRNKRGKKPFFAKKDEKNEVFVLRDVKGPADAPTELILELVEDKETVSVSKEKPFKRVDGYMVDLRYPFENRPPWLSQRVGGVLKFGGEEYNIVAITKTEVVVLAKSNQKKTPVPIPQN